MSGYENVYVNAEEAEAAASQIDTGVKNLRDGIEALNSAMNKFHENTLTQWEGDFNENWKGFYTRKFPSIVSALEGQAANLRTAAQAARNLNS